MLRPVAQTVELQSQELPELQEFAQLPEEVRHSREEETRIQDMSRKVVESAFQHPGQLAPPVRLWLWVDLL